MTLLISLALAGVFVLLCGGSLKKRPWVYYCLAILTAGAVCGCTFAGVSFPRWFTVYVWPVLAQGGLAAGLFVLVMFAGALPNGSGPVKRLMPLRGELSILACILTFGHNIAYGKTYFLGIAGLPRYQQLAAVCSVAMLCILIPLFVTSFPAVRRKMKAKKWKRIQRWAYGFYGLLYVHILLLTVPQALRGRSGYGLTIGAYTAVFVCYALCRVAKARAVKTRRTAGLAARQRGLAVCAVCAAALLSLGLTRAGTMAAAAVVETETAEVTASPVSTAEPDPDPPVPSPTATAEPSPAAEEETQSVSRRYQDGVYTGEAFGYMDYIVVSVTVEGAVITDIAVTGYWDDDAYYEKAVSVIDDILAAQSTEVDAATGATYSAQGILDAVAAALESARVSE